MGTHSAHVYHVDLARLAVDTVKDCDVVTVHVVLRKKARDVVSLEVIQRHIVTSVSTHISTGNVRNLGQAHFGFHVIIGVYACSMNSTGSDGIAIALSFSTAALRLASSFELAESLVDARLSLPSTLLNGMMLLLAVHLHIQIWLKSRLFERKQPAFITVECSPTRCMSRADEQDSRRRQDGQQSSTQLERGRYEGRRRLNEHPGLDRPLEEDYDGKGQERRISKPQEYHRRGDSDRHYDYGSSYPVPPRGGPEYVDYRNDSGRGSYTGAGSHAGAFQ